MFELQKKISVKTRNPTKTSVSLDEKANTTAWTRVEDKHSNTEGKEPQQSGRPTPGWKVFIFFLPGNSNRPPKSPKGKTWLEILLLLLKVLAALFALWKAVAVTTLLNT